MRPTRFWSEAFKQSASALTPKEIKLQEAIYEIACGEEDLVEDMQLVQKIYADSLLRLNILTKSEVEMVFGNLRALSPVHVELYRAMRTVRCTNTGISKTVGQILNQWVGKLHQPYVTYCSNLIKVRKQ